MSKARQLAQKPTQPTGRKNLIINGAMQVAQRGTSVTDVTGVGYYTIDRWDVGLSSNGTYTISQASDSPSGFTKSFKYLCTTANTTLDGSQYVTLRQRIEAQNLQHLKFGSSDATNLTVSFWVKSNKTGTYTLSVEPDDAGLNNGKTYTINSANTWEYKTVTFSGQTSGTAIANDIGTGIELQWWLSSGSNFNSGTFTEDNYTNTSSNRVSPNQVNLSDAINNYWQITGVQLEVGSVATEFEHRSYDEELALCQRYYYRWEQATSGVSSHGLHIIAMYQATRGFFGMSSPVPMRANPSVAELGSLALTTPSLSSDGTISSLVMYAADNNNTRFSIDATISGGTANVYRSIYAGVDSGIVLNVEL